MNPLLTLSNFLFPRRCHLCDHRLASGEKYICLPCLQSLPRTNYHMRPHNPMELRFDGLVNYRRATSLLFYAPHSDVAIVIQDFKYNKFRGLARYFGTLLAREFFSTSFFTDIDVIVPIPMHFFKQAQRGYNQVEEIARGLSEITGIRMDTSLKAVKPHRTQTALSHHQRINNLRGVFELKDPTPLQGCHILLIDDVCTTGSTLTEAAAAISAKLPSATFSLLTVGVTF